MSTHCCHYRNMLFREFLSSKRHSNLFVLVEGFVLFLFESVGEEFFARPSRADVVQKPTQGASKSCSAIPANQPRVERCTRNSALDGRSAKSRKIYRCRRVPSKKVAKCSADISQLVTSFRTSSQPLAPNILHRYFP